VWVKDSIIMTLLAIVVIIIIYLGFYWALPLKKD